MTSTGEQPRVWTISCRRCGKRYALPGGTILPACPFCNASPRPLLGGLRDNRVAVTFAAVALVFLAVALTVPFAQLKTLGESREYSLPGGIRRLFIDGHVWIGVILLIFSVIFPVAKLLALLTATSGLMRLSLQARRRLHQAADLTGKYSLLDVLVVAVLIVVVQFRGVIEVEARAGVYWFCAAVVLSILAGLCVRLPDPQATGPKAACAPADPGSVSDGSLPPARLTPPDSLSPARVQQPHD
ncbi:MAG: paraquat-inducible protein A [Phycisphaerae bacterium]|nr:paraquat-inducible protein A [Phycisphaerae bacterium]MDW8263395.1 paraquat-inducible protein A [Phycisphaerales bacterium]